MNGRWHDYLDAQIAARPTALAVTDSVGTHWDFAGLDAACREITDLLRAKGVQAGDRVMLVTENSGAGMASVFACSRMGAIVSPINARQTAGELTKLMEHARPAAMLFASAVSPDAKAHAKAPRARD